MDTTRGLWTSEYFYREASKVGPATRKVIEELSQQKQSRPGLPSCRNVLSMGKRQQTILEEACLRLTSMMAADVPCPYRSEKHDGRGTQRAHHRPRGFDQAQRTTTPILPDSAVIEPRDTTGALLAAQTSSAWTTYEERNPKLMTNSTPPMDRFLDESVLADFTALRMTAFGKTG
ncbi:transposase [Corynebacterium striatum]|uniref:hypothetical protein n=1 Tax=Corynebacterium striatum TaxID=43770 RepID=UPI000E00AA91|nr:hypothetical protein [Corynebacterium striatum]STD85185.1 transposase [Corynebacterium striatum]